MSLYNTPSPEATLEITNRWRRFFRITFFVIAGLTLLSAVAQILIHFRASSSDMSPAAVSNRNQMMVFYLALKIASAGLLVTMARRRIGWLLGTMLGLLVFSFAAGEAWRILPPSLYSLMRWVPGLPVLAGVPLGWLRTVMISTGLFSGYKAINIFHLFENVCLIVVYILALAKQPKGSLSSTE